MSNYPFVYLSIHPSIHPSILLFSPLIYLSVNLSISLSFHPSALLSIRLCSRPSIILFLVYVSICLPFSLSRSVQFPVSLCVLLSIHRSSCLSGHPAIHSLHLSTEAFHQSIYLVLVFPPGQFNSKQAGYIFTY